MLNLKIGHQKLGLVPHRHYAILFDGVNVTLLALRFGHFSLWSVWAILNVFSAGGANIGGWLLPSGADLYFRAIVDVYTKRVRAKKINYGSNLLLSRFRV